MDAMLQLLDPEDHLFEPEMPSIVDVIGLPEEFGDYLQRRDWKKHDCGSCNKVGFLDRVESMDPLAQMFAGLRIHEEYVDYYGYGLRGGGGGHPDVGKCPSKTSFSNDHGEDLLRHEGLGHGQAVRNVAEPDEKQSLAMRHSVLTTDCIVPVENNEELEVKVKPRAPPRHSPPPLPKFKPECEPSGIELAKSPPSDGEVPNATFDVKKRPPVLCDADLEDNGDEESRGVDDLSKLPKPLQVPSGTPEVAPRKVRQSISTCKFACPYLKFDPKTYGQRPSCRGPSFPSTHRVKEHLYRVHGQKPNCDRCRKIFSTEEDVKKHRRSKDACELAEGVVIEGFDASQKEKLQSKKRTRSKSEEEKWQDIFQILFPDCREVPDPFYNPYFDAGLGDSALAPRDIEKIFTDDFREQICDGIEKAIGTHLSRTKRRNVTDAVMEALRQGQTTAKDDSSKVAVEIPEGEQDVSPESSDPDSGFSEPLRSGHKARTTKSAGVLSEENDQKRTRQILNEPARPTRLVEEKVKGPSLEPREFKLGEELNLGWFVGWTGSIEDGMDYDWFRDVENSGFQMPVIDLIGEEYEGLLPSSDVGGSFPGVNW
ncbi:hypothetical protein CkaCkLH20_03164 [Colletotrichum karsti]|uniref:C2H2-type domain-containing protein n=1 Tax=Colletotrichum karsti TaxID=1095194 RepID=A0A9P6IFJ6_9PEZI|nr:uncharacterized protein CkaCkLH20_03164 [Colletotrichum karsti]KAF9879621.1 hypothetical protein CkaCkLH20_03164 [Colletotrichum karsti]